MKRVEFNCYGNLVGTMQTLITCSSEDEYKVISVIAHYDVIKRLFEELILYGEHIDGLIELETSDYSDYDKEFKLHLTEDGIAIEKAWCDEDGQKEPNYYFGTGDVVFIHEDCNSKILERIESDVILEFGFVDECEDTDSYEECYGNCHGCEECCAECDVCGCEDYHCDDTNDGYKELLESKDENKTDVTVKSEEQYFVNGKSVSKDEYEKFSKEFNEKMKETFDNFNAWSLCTKSLLNMFDSLSGNMNFFD